MKLRPGNYGKETSFEARTVDAEMPLDEYVRLPKHPLYRVLDNLRRAFIVGSIFRTADADVLSGGPPSVIPLDQSDAVGVKILIHK